MSSSVRLCEVGPRDGLQNEPETLSVAQRAAFITALAQAGHKHIECGAFVRAASIPQMADTAAVLAALPPLPGVALTALVPNLEGMDAALAAGCKSVAVFTATSESFSRKNTNANVAESMQRIEQVAARCRSSGTRLRGYVSTVLHCPLEGRTDPARAVAIAERLRALGCAEISFGETTGKATPAEVRVLCQLIQAAGLMDCSALHFHDTFGMGIANALVAYEAGARSFDSSAGGLGGCPNAPGAAGNVATEDLLHLFAGLGVSTGVDLALQVRAGQVVAAALGRALPGRAWRALIQSPR